MAFGAAAAGPVPGADGRYRSRTEYLDAMRTLVDAGALDILLTSASNGERLADEGALGNGVTLAVRANDTTDVWNPRGGTYVAQPSRPFRTADLAAVRPFCDLVLYSVTFNNDLDRDIATLEAYRTFRHDAGAVGMRYFLEVFNPNAPVGLAPRDVGAFVNDCIVRDAGRRHARRATAVPEDAVQRGRRAGGARRARPVAGRRHPRRVRGHHPRHVRAAAAGPGARRPRRAVRAQDPAGGVAARPGRPHAPGAARRAEPGSRPCGSTTTRWPRPVPPPSAAWRRIWR